MKLNKFLRCILALSSTVVILSGCGEDEDLGGRNWNYTKEDIASADYRPYSYIEHVDGFKYSFTYSDPEFPMTMRNITKDDIICFQKSLLEKDKSYATCDYVTVDMLRKYEIRVYDFGSLNEGFSFDFYGTDDRTYGVLVHKDLCKRGKYLMLGKELSITAEKTNEQFKNFEGKYFSTPIPSYNRAQTVFKLLQNISNLFLSGNPGSSLAGLFGIISNIFDFLKITKSYTLADVMNQLYIMDQKLDYITSIILDNTSRLGQQITHVQMGIDKILFEQLTTRINDFETHFIIPLENYFRTLSVEAQTFFKNQISNPSEITLFYAQATDGKYVFYSPYEEHDNATELKFRPNYAKCNQYLQKTGGILGNGFQGELYDDLYDSIVNQNIKMGNRDQKLLAEDFCAGIVDLFFYNKFNNNATEAANVLNLVIPLLQKISAVGVASIVDDITTRLSYMYNFASETSQILQDIYAKMLVMMDQYTGLACEICTIAKVNQYELGQCYIAAKNHILEVKESVKNTKPNYCYVTKSVLTANFQHIYTTTSFDFSKGSIGKFNHKLNVTAEKYNVGKGVIDGTDYYKERQSDNPVEQTNITIMGNRFRLLNQMGLADGRTFYAYLRSVNVLEKGSEGAIIYHILNKDKFNRSLSENSLAFVGRLSTRALGSGDNQVQVECDSKGYMSSHNYYFTIGKLYNYEDQKTGHGKPYWDGIAYLGTKTSAIDGSAFPGSDNFITCCAHYYERGGWIHPEHWGFKHDTGYYLSLHTKAS